MRVTRRAKLFSKSYARAVILKIKWRRILNNKWRSAAAMSAREIAASDQVRRCGQAGSQGSDIPPLAWSPSS